MKTTGTQAVLAPPSLITSLLAGFDTVTNHIGLILFPVALDLLLWFGPHLRVQSLALRIGRQLTYIPGVPPGDAGQTIATSQELITIIAERMNLLTMLRTFPVGIPSLMVSRLPVATPFGTPLMRDVGSAWIVLTLWLLLTAAGLIAGSLYYSMVAQVTFKGKLDWGQVFVTWGWASSQVLLQALTIGLLLMVIAVPAVCLLSAISLSGVFMGQIALLVFAGLGLWVIFPLFFSAHGIFTFQFKAWNAMRHSARIFRFTVIPTSLLFTSIVVISEGLDTLWRIPAENSWLALLGITGHAFISTSLLAASFIFYRDAFRWQQRVVQQSLLADSGKGLRA